MANVKDDDVETLDFADESEYADGVDRDVIDEVAELIADTFGRSVIEADRYLAGQICNRIAKEYGFGV